MSNFNFQKSTTFFIYLGFLSRPFTNHRTDGEGGAYFFNSSLPLPTASQTLRNWPSAHLFCWKREIFCELQLMYSSLSVQKFLWIYSTWHNLKMVPAILAIFEVQEKPGFYTDVVTKYFSFFKISQALQKNLEIIVTQFLVIPRTT